MKRKAALFNETGSGMVDYVYAGDRRARLAALTDLYPEIITSDNFAEHAPKLRDIEVVFSTWGMPPLTAARLAQLPALKAVFYAAGSVKGFARPVLEQGVLLCSAWVINGQTVASFTLAQILLACKGYWRNTADCTRRGRDPQVAPYRAPGIYGRPVALIGFGAIGQRVAELLQPFSVQVLVVDPYVDETVLARYGARRVSLEEAFAQAFIVSNHLPNLDSLQGVIGGDHFRSLPEGGCFINTGRGAQVREDEMVAALRQRPDLTVLLDVTFPEPPPPGSPLYDLPNVHLTSHIAGVLNEEVVQMADAMMDQFVAWDQGREPRYTVTLDMLELLA